MSTAANALRLCSCAAALLVLASGHGQLVMPQVRPDSHGELESWEHRRPAFTSELGNVFGASETSYRCHDMRPAPGPPPTTLVAGQAFNATWKMEAGHPGDCYFYLSYDADYAEPKRFFKIWGIPGCGALDGKAIPDVVTRTITLPEELPPCEHCVLRWEWTAHQQVKNIEYYLSCADVRIASRAPPTRPEPMVEIAGVEHLPADPGAYRKVYSDEGPEERYLVGPAIATYSLCDSGSEGCVGGDVEVPMPVRPQPGPAPVTTSPPQLAGPPCACAASTLWNGSLSAFTGADFCAQDFGGAGPYISGGGGDGSSGSWSGPGPCVSGQYAFSREEGWRISVSGEQGVGKMPYRAFAYLQLCGGRPYSECLADGSPMSLSFSFRTKGAEEMGAFVKLLFWTDAGGVIGLLPPWHEKGDGKYRLVAFMSDDFPNRWAHSAELMDHTWYHLRVDFVASGAGDAANVGVWLDGAKVGDGVIPVGIAGATSGPQLGVYSFDLSTRAWPHDGFQLWLDDMCLGKTSGVCPSGAAASGLEEPEYEQPEDGPKVPTPPPPPSATPSPQPEPAPTSVGPTTEPPSSAPVVDPVPQPTPCASCCAQEWEQCGGQGWDGANCCMAGLACREQNPWYSQCLSAEVAEPREPEHDMAPPVCGDEGARCGGRGFLSSWCCNEGLTCLELSATEAKCVPSGHVSMPPPLLSREALLETERRVVSVADTEVCRAARARAARRKGRGVKGFLSPEHALLQLQAAEASADVAQLRKAATVADEL
mmetsp:Transcript_53981/g.155834  ORF Transcript_53981/g.155834 Transcript_53981/m.155834 type:complete len:765 (-) Transcript_53981:138-2432(-)